MTHRWWIMPALALALALGACGITTGEPVPVIEVRTSAEQYAATDSVTVRLVNRTREDAWFHHCDNRISFTVEARSATGAWQDLMGVDGPQCQAVLESGVLRLRPAESYSRTFALDGTGTFRLRILSSHSELNVGYNVLYSNVFTIE